MKPIKVQHFFLKKLIKLRDAKYIINKDNFYE